MSNPHRGNRPPATNVSKRPEPAQKTRCKQRQPGGFNDDEIVHLSAAEGWRRNAGMYVGDTTTPLGVGTWSAMAVHAAVAQCQPPHGPVDVIIRPGELELRTPGSELDLLLLEHFDCACGRPDPAWSLGASITNALSASVTLWNGNQQVRRFVRGERVPRPENRQMCNMPENIVRVDRTVMTIDDEIFPTPEAQAIDAGELANVCRLLAAGYGCVVRLHDQRNGPAGPRTECSGGNGAAGLLMSLEANGTSTPIFRGWHSDENWSLELALRFVEHGECAQLAWNMDQPGQPAVDGAHAIGLAAALHEWLPKDRRGMDRIASVTHALAEVAGLQAVLIIHRGRPVYRCQRRQWWDDRDGSSVAVSRVAQQVLQQIDPAPIAARMRTAPRNSHSYWHAAWRRLDSTLPPKWQWQPDTSTQVAPAFHVVGLAPSARAVAALTAVEMVEPFVRDASYWAETLQIARGALARDSYADLELPGPDGDHSIETPGADHDPQHQETVRVLHSAFCNVLKPSSDSQTVDLAHKAAALLCSQHDDRLMQHAIERVFIARWKVIVQHRLAMRDADTACLLLNG